MTWNHWIEQLNIFSYYFFQSTMVNFSDKLVSYFACYNKVRAISQVSIWRIDVGVRPPYFVPTSNKQWIIELASYWCHCFIYIWNTKTNFYILITVKMIITHSTGHGRNASRWRLPLFIESTFLLFITVIAINRQYTRLISSFVVYGHFILNSFTYPFETWLHS